MRSLVMAAAAIALVLATASGCTSSRRGRDGTRGDGGLPSDGGPGRDAACLIECAAPPPGCHYEGDVSCDPPSCGTLVCEEDAGLCAPCVAPPDGCYYVDGCTCSGLTCPDIACGVGEPRFPEFDRRCEVDVDCTVANHMVDCCGTFHAMGIAAYEAMRFAEAEARCESMYPACGCASGPTTADDGTTGFDSPATVLCMAGVCTTTFAPPP